MKHFTTCREKEERHSTGNASLMLLRAALMVLIFGLANGPLIAQCDLNCLGSDPGQPLIVVIDEDCEVNLDTTILLAASSTCPGDKRITIRDTMSNVIVSGDNQASFNAVPYYGQLLRVTIEDLQSNLFCNSFVTLVDTFPPAIVCVSDTVNCLADTSVASLGYPLITDNCSGDISVSYVDTMMNFPCMGPEVALIERTWTAMDIFGNCAECVQPIHLKRPKLEDIVFPSDTTLACDGSSPIPDVVGWPILNGDTIINGSECFLSVFYEDDTIASCSDQTYGLLRTWTIMETCSDLEVSETQLISVVDTVAPQITCPPSVTASTSLASCHARVTLPLPTIMDNCDADATFFVNTSYGAVGLGPHSFVPVGTHTLQYTAIDPCQNTRTCTTTLNVVDAGPPVAICDSGTIVSIPSGGYGTINAITFDEGSTDNCNSTLYFKAKRVEPGGCSMANGDDAGLPGYQEWFDDDVRFCCEDIGEGVEILLHVYEIDPGQGPIDPTREIPNGDLFGHFAECRTNVDIMDMLAPKITCPQDTIIDCTADYSDFSMLGFPTVSDNCGAQLIPLEEMTINDCGTGTISRTFEAVDPSGNTASCTQLITVVKVPLVEEDIIWPENYTLSLCGASTEPEDLPAGFDQPTVADLNCSNVAINYVDELFNIAVPACYKILRQWTIIDWCDYDPDYPDGGGRFTNLQIIKVEDNDDPILDCPADVTRSVSNDCSGAMVNLPLVTAVDCNPNLIITNDSPYALSGGPNASGTYPLGITEVTYSVVDRCGNFSNCTVNITVQDNTPPSPLCIVGLSINLSDAGADGFAVLPAVSFDGGSADNCTNSADLRRTLRLAGTGIPGTPPATTELTLTCGDRGNQTVEFWVTDAVGNSGYCVTVIAVQDNNGVCPQQASGMIAGDIQTEMGEFVDNVMISTSGNTSMQGFTEDFGFFEIMDVPYGSDYTISAQRDDGPLNGVSTLDLLLISKHILGVQLLDSPYKQIAADVNRSGSVSTLDMIGLRKMILGQETTFPNGNTSWRFVDAIYTFPDPQDAFASPFPEYININNFAQSEMDADFVAIKVGDVDNSAASNNLLGVEGRMAGVFPIRLPEVQAGAGELIRIPFTARQLREVLGYQFSLGFEAEYLEWVALETGNLPGLTDSHFNLDMASQGTISTSWHWPTATTVKADEEALLFTLLFRTRKAVKTLKPLFFTENTPTPAEAYDKNGSLLDIQLQYKETQPRSEEQFELFQNRPNPFTSETTIGFRLPKGGVTRLSVIDLSGKLIYEKEAYFESGYHEVKLSATDLPARGVLYYQLETAKHTMTKKMILM